VLPTIAAVDPAASCSAHCPFRRLQSWENFTLPPRSNTTLSLLVWQIKHCHLYSSSTW
jgi:hypothetical protein